MMAWIDGLERVGRLATAGLLLAACPGDDAVTPVDTDAGTTAATTDGPQGCTPGETQTCPCASGTPGMQTCLPDGDGFSTCECEGETSGSDSGTTGPSDTTGSAEDSTTGPVPCVTDEDCVEAARGECYVGVCGEDGMCLSEEAAFGTPCGDATDDECTAPDTCNDGACMPNDVADGLSCSTCASGVCTCTAGLCDECNSFAPVNNFTTAMSADGWTLTGGWALRREAPQSQLAGPAYFPGQVLGTDGNRVAPYPGAEVEVSYALTPPTTLPAMIAFLTWNIDEGGGASDNKTIRATTDGGATWTVLADCVTDPSWPFCTYATTADPGIWSLAQIPVPPALQGQVAQVEFGYDSGDSCCDFEQGWYIDSLNIATQCVCSTDADCAGADSECGTGFCQPTGECGLIPVALDTACGDPFENDCNGADTCDGSGYCRDNMQPTGLSLCGDCPGGGVCSFCDAGMCLDCNAFSDFGDFNDPGSVAEWQITSVVGTADWGLYDEAPPNNVAGSLPVAFPNAPVYGTDGNRNPPYPGNSESEHSYVITGEGVVPTTLTFLSWHVDEGGGFYDRKRIALTVDGGVSWNTLVDCQTLPGGQPFCLSEPDGRLGTDWDPISIDTSMWEGMTGQLRFTYETVDSCCSFERGWFIDDLNAFSTTCDDEPFVSP